jgi:hypothetical protein
MALTPPTSPFPLPVPNILCQTSRMKHLTATLCLTIAVLLGSAGSQVFAQSLEDLRAKLQSMEACSRSLSDSNCRLDLLDPEYRELLKMRDRYSKSQTPKSQKSLKKRLIVQLMAPMNFSQMEFLKRTLM